MAKRSLPIAKIIVFGVMIMPTALLLWQWGLLLSGEPTPRLGTNPVQKTVLETGEYAVRALLIALCISPLATLFRRPGIMSVRRMMGLFAFFYAFIHGLSYIGMDQLFSLSTLWEDLLKRWPIALGMIAFVGLVPLAVTSTRAMVRRLGAKSWQRLHRLVYAVAVIAVIHNILITKGWQVEPLVHAGILALLLLYRAAGRPRLPKWQAAWPRPS